MFALPPPFLTASAASAASAIRAALKSWWSLDENAASPTYNDSQSTNHLTQRNAGGDVNTSVNSSATALKGRAWFPNHTDNLALRIPRSNTNLDAVDSDFSFGGWFKMNIDAATEATVMGRQGGTTTKIDACLYVESDNKVKFAISTDGSAGGRIIADAGVSFSSTTYALVIGTYDKTAGFVRIRYRLVGGSFVLVSTALGGGTVFTGTNASNFTIGDSLDTDTNFSSANRNAIVLADECLYINKAITDSEFDYLYNGGAGKSYANLLAD